MTIPTQHNCPHIGDGWCLQCVRKLAEENERLRAIVDKLPKTADGVPVVPGMMVFVKVGEHIDERRVVGPYGRNGLLTREPAKHGSCEGTIHRLAAFCHSTREAAEAARNPTDDTHGKDSTDDGSRSKS